ncbi:hypothetical protein BS78_07G007900 [Paspalum vaginatum]|nr:hypothetical protein BS78_07G007900 [Paspalum vaginatum]
MEQRCPLLWPSFQEATAPAPAPLPKPPVRACDEQPPLLPLAGDPPHRPLRQPQARLRSGERGAPASKRLVPGADRHPSARRAGAAGDIRGGRDGGARAGDRKDQGVLEPAPAAGLGAGHEEEADRGGGEGRVGRAGVGRGGRRPPPVPVRDARALAPLQEAHAQDQRPQVKSSSS